MENKEFNVSGEWDKMADAYTELIVSGTLQPNIALYNAARAKDAKAICEVGVGPGLGPLVFTTAFMKKGSVYYNSDISENMIGHFHKLFTESEITDNPKIKFDSIEKGVKVDKIEDSDESVKKIFVTIADNEDLPYPDEAFDCYIANLSLMHVSDSDKMLKEAYRVTQKGGRIGISVIGRPENFKFWTVIPEALKAVTDVPKMTGGPTKFGDRAVFKSLLEEHGFKNPKMTYVTMIVGMSIEQAFEFSTTSHRFSKMYEALDNEQKEQVKTAFFKIWEEKFGEGSIDPPTVELLVATADK
jgi:ubiquinone/menaquinone biosynthesis C-methylase UbiE